MEADFVDDVLGVLVHEAFSFTVEGLGGNVVPPFFQVTVSIKLPACSKSPYTLYALECIQYYI